MHTKYIFTTIALFIVYVGNAQTSVTGKVLGPNDQNSIEGLPYANVVWKETLSGASCDGLGHFVLKRPQGNEKHLIVSFVGYKTDTVFVAPGQANVEVVLKRSTEIEQVTIVNDTQGTYLSKLKPINTQQITSEGLKKLACCNLSESFENNASIDAGYSDALSGARQIQLLGLSGVYSQLLTENLPGIRGLATTYGLTYIPGSWMEGIQVSKGTSSVTNGYESMTGQINVEYKKAETSEPLFINLYGNDLGRMEANVSASVPVNDKWTTLLMGHYSTLQNKIDHNNDGFLDVPMTEQINLFNRWDYENGERMEAKTVVKYLEENRYGGQTMFDHNKPDNNISTYGIGINSKNFQAYNKTGFAIGEHDKSLGVINSVTVYDQNSNFGNNRYRGSQKSYYMNLLYQTSMNGGQHKITSGASFMMDRYSEQLNDTSFVRDEYVPGIFSQYTWMPNDNFTAMLGFRADWNSYYGMLYTPRLHIKYNLHESTTVRLSAGRGYRSACIIAENTGILASSRQIRFLDKFRMEDAWNFGTNVSKDFTIASRNFTITADFYRTQFNNQVIVDMNSDSHQVFVDNLKGKSYSNSFQVELTGKYLPGLDVTTAYRINDVKQTYKGQLTEKPFAVKHRGLVTLSYTTPGEHWMFDFTTQFNGKTRLPNTSANEAAYRLPGFSPSYIYMLGQITYKFKKLDIYLGGENLTDYTQKNPILAATDPFGSNFDASIIWGPIMGRMVYVGIRFALPKRDHAGE